MKRDVEFELGDQVYMKLSPMKGLMMFGKKGKFNCHYIGPHKNVRYFEIVSYELDLP